ncbi:MULTISPECIES: LIC_10190 family membrane protein [Empedobacter]|uniref:LIC_10190 family membrane protein n=1 Tax=Empedobacter TaxID=59734 RepID=UPI00390C8DA6
MQFFLSIALFFYFLGFGFLFQKIFPRINSTISFTVINGMIGVGLISFFVAFFLPLNFTYEVVLFSIAILSLIYHRNEVKRSLLKLKNISRYFYAFTFVGLLVAVTYPFILDHFGYYIPTIKWLDFAGFVKGLSNFEWVLAQNSFWHILQASINETLDIYYRLNFCLFLIFNLYVFELKQKKLFIFNLLFLFFLNTPSPDLPVFVLSILLINEYLCNENKASDYFFYAVILFVIKPISIVLILFFGIEYLRNKEHKNLKDKNLFYLFLLLYYFVVKELLFLQILCFL